MLIGSPYNELSGFHRCRAAGALTRQPLCLSAVGGDHVGIQSTMQSSRMKRMIRPMVLAT